jgi:signal transduction histidine kinase
MGKTLSGYAKITSDLTEKQRYAEALQHSHDLLELRVVERTRELAAANAALVSEINERKTAERQKIEFLQRLVTSQEDQRQRIARDLHDQLGQRLTALRLKIAAMKEVCSHDENLKARAVRLQEVAELLDSEVSFLAWELRPFALDELGLVDAIGTFVREWSKHYEIPAEFHSSGLANVPLDESSDSHLYRIAQEALNNIVKHSRASAVNVLLEKTGDELVLIVEDNGVGMKPSERSNGRKGGKGLGLEGMRERASLIGGSLEIESAPGAGTTVYARIPLRKEK